MAIKLTVIRGVTFDTDDRDVWRNMLNRELGVVRDDPRRFVPGTVKVIHPAPGKRWLIEYEVRDAT